MEKRGVALFGMVRLVLRLFSGGARQSVVVNYGGADQKISSITFFGNKYEPENPDIRVSYLTAEAAMRLLSGEMPEDIVQWLNGQTSAGGNSP